MSRNFDFELNNLHSDETIPFFLGSQTEGKKKIIIIIIIFSGTFIFELNPASEPTQPSRSDSHGIQLMRLRLRFVSRGEPGRGEWRNAGALLGFVAEARGIRRQGRAVAQGRLGERARLVAALGVFVHGSLLYPLFNMIVFLFCFVSVLFLASKVLASLCFDAKCLFV